MAREPSVSTLASTTVLSGTFWRMIGSAPPKDAGDDRHATGHHVTGDPDQALPFPVGQAGSLANFVRNHEAAGSLTDLPLDEPAEGNLIDPLVRKWRRQ
jgi:hypothetical protein